MLRNNGKLRDHSNTFIFLTHAKLFFYSDITFVFPVGHLRTPVLLRGLTFCPATMVKLCHKFRDVKADLLLICGDSPCSCDMGERCFRHCYMYLGTCAKAVAMYFPPAAPITILTFPFSSTMMDGEARDMGLFRGFIVSGSR